MSRKFEHPDPYGVITTFTFSLGKPLSTGPVRQSQRKRPAGVATARKSRPTNASGTGKDT